MLFYRLTGGVLDGVQGQELDHRFETYTLPFSILVEAMREFVGNARRLLARGIARGDYHHWNACGLAASSSSGGEGSRSAHVVLQ
jgi:hypothetical protein